MKETYSSECSDLFNVIKRGKRGCNKAWLINAEPIINSATVILFLLTILSSVVCLIAIFCCWVADTGMDRLIAFAIALGISLLVALCSFLFFISWFPRLSVKIKVSQNVYLGDKIFLEQQRRNFFVVSAFYYYQGSVGGNVVAKKRFSAILELPELLDYLIENGLAYNADVVYSEYSHDMNVIDFRKYITEYYGERLKRPADFLPFYVVNTAMLENQIKSYIKEVPTRDTPLKRENFLYSQYANWWEGNLDGKKKFLEYLPKASLWEKTERPHSMSTYVSWEEPFLEFCHTMDEIIALENDLKTETK